MRISWKTVPNCRELNWTRIDGVLITWICLHFDFPSRVVQWFAFSFISIFFFSVCCYLWHRCTATAISSLHSSEKWRLPMSAGWALKSFPSPSKVKLLPHTCILCPCVFVCLFALRSDGNWCHVSHSDLMSSAMESGPVGENEWQPSTSDSFDSSFPSVESDGISFISISFYIP